MKVSVTIQGVAPLLMNRFTEAGEVALSSGTTAIFKGHKGTPREQAEPKRYADAEGNLFIPGANIYACIIAAGTFHRAGKSKLTTLSTSLIPAGVMLEDLVCPLHDAAGQPLTAWEVDSRSVVNPSTRGRVMCYRPRIDVWQCTFGIDIDTSMFAPDLIRAVLDDAGKKIGLGDYRPARKGPFGRFVVVKWEVLETALPKVA